MHECDGYGATIYRAAQLDSRGLIDATSVPFIYLPDGLLFFYYCIVIAFVRPVCFFLPRCRIVGNILILDRFHKLYRAVVGEARAHGLQCAIID